MWLASTACSKYKHAPPSYPKSLSEFERPLQLNRGRDRDIGIRDPAKTKHAATLKFHHINRRLKHHPTEKCNAAVGRKELAGPLPSPLVSYL